MNFLLEFLTVQDQFVSQWLNASCKLALTRVTALVSGGRL